MAIESFMSVRGSCRVVVTNLRLSSKGHLGDQMRLLGPSSAAVLPVRDELSSGRPFPTQSVCESQREAVQPAGEEH